MKISTYGVATCYARELYKSDITEIVPKVP